MDITSIARVAGVGLDTARNVLRAYWRSQGSVHNRVTRAMAPPVPLFRLRPPESLTPNPRLWNSVCDSILDSPTAVRVLYTPPGRGKTTCARHVLSTMQATELVRGAFRWNAAKLPVTAADAASIDQTFASALKATLGLDPEAWGDSVGEMMPPLEHEGGKRWVLFIDQAEKFLDHVDPGIADTFLTSLAETAQLQDNYTVLVNVSKEHHANFLLGLNGGTKFTSVLPPGEEFAWTPDELAALAERLCDVEDIDIAFTSSEMQRIIDQSRGPRDFLKKIKPHRQM